MRISVTLLFFFSCALVASGCTVGPDFIRSITAADRSEGFINQIYNGDQSSAPISHWWKSVNDPLLNSYVDTLLGQNLSLIQAGERVVQAREVNNIERGNYSPSVGLNGSASRNFSGVNSFTGTSGSRLFINSLSADLDASWQVDLFGRVRRSVEASRARFEASVYDREALTHSLIAELFNRRVSIAVNKNLLQLAQQNSDNRQKIYGLVRNRYDLGVRNTSLADVYLAEESFSSTEADIYQFERLLAGDSYRLDVLLGQAPGYTDPLADAFTLIAPPLNMPICMPSDLLDRRPDLKASELRLKASNADIGIAVADLYPSLNLAGSLGFSGNSARNLFSADQLAGSILSSLTTRLFEGGKLRANIRLQKSEARELAASYADNVLNAMREVETALKGELELSRELQSVQRSVDALKNAEKVSQERYIRGIITLQDLLNIQQRRYLAQQNLLRTQQEKWTTRVSLYMALGGDWLNEQNSKMNACTRGEAL